jgi:Tol biopolymer transport system component
MPLSSDRETAGVYQTLLAARPTRASSFGAPTAITELTFPDHTTVDAFLSDDGLTMFYASAPPGAKLDLYVAWRKTTAQPFSVAVPLDDLNTAADERDPWLSPDGTVFYFSSDRSGLLQIYEVAAWRGPSAGQ